MRVPVSWLRELVDVDATASDIADRLAESGTNVEAIERLGGDVAGVIAARVSSVREVPDSDKLCLAELDAGPRGPFTVVAGAKNFRAGDVLPLAVPGSRVTTLRNVGVRRMVDGKYESQGMVCSAKELGLSEDHEGILVLDPGVEPGADVVGLLGLDDEVLVLEIMPNRPDCMSMIGIAREVSVLLGRTLHPLDVTVGEDGIDVSSLTSVSVEDAMGCPRYLARVVEEVTFGPSPALVQARLSACGFRPLGNLVDATNYVLLLTGQPMHAFDLDTLGEERIVVRRARPAERLLTLDGDEHELDSSDLVIADAKDAQAIAGVMGGASSEVGPRTRRILLESAYFDPVSIARTSRRRHMRTEASARFERGADPEMVPRAAAVCARLMSEWAGGRVAAGVVDVGSAPSRRVVPLRAGRVQRVMGVAVDDDTTVGLLEGLGCGVRAAGKHLDVVVPSFRPDLEREIDLVEEVARLYGFDRVPTRMPTGQRGSLTREQHLRRRVRDVLMGAGLSEAMLTSFLTAAQLEMIGRPFAVRVSNPMTVEQERLRPSLLPGLVAAAAHNSSQGVPDVRLFEIGSVFVDWPSGADLPREELRVGFVLTGHVAADDWHTPARPIDAYDVRGIVEALLRELGVGDFTTAACDDSPFHPGRSARVLLDGADVGVFGELRPSVASGHDLTGGAAVCELKLEPILVRAPRTLRVRELPRFPAIARDVSMIVDDSLAAGTIAASIREAAGEHLESLVLFDLYRGAPVPPSRKSVAYRLTLRAPDRTLTSAEADAVRERVVAALRDRHGGAIR